MLQIPLIIIAMHNDPASDKPSLMLMETEELMCSRKDAGFKGWACSQMRQLVVPCENKKKLSNKSTFLNFGTYLQENF